MSIFEIVGLAAAAFVAGAINAVAGGGSLISFPALLAAGYDSKAANVTNTVAIWPGTLGGSLAYRSEISRQPTRIIALLVPAIVGALAGSALLLATSSDTFDAIVPFLILTGVAIMVFQEPLGRFLSRRNAVARSIDHVPVLLQGVVFTAAIYGGYFGAGFGIIILAFLSILLPDDLHHSNALKGILAMIVNGVAVVYFILFGPVQWGPAALMAAFAMAGGFLGVGLARRLGPVWLRRGVILYGTVAAIVLFVR
ncbi:MAG: sulfite exporter TauE/SafE family protein [Chloroflexota bacterium]